MELKARCKERFEPVVQAIRQLQKEKEGLDEPLIVAIDGRCGSGKTTLGEYLEQVFDCNLFRMDDFFLRMEQRTPQRLKETGGNVDYDGIKTDLSEADSFLSAVQLPEMESAGGISCSL